MGSCPKTRNLRAPGEQAGITFIGPSHTILEQMGDKLTAKTIAAACGVPTIPGSARPLTDENDAIALAEAYGYPVLLKAAGGGGGRGMRRCDSAEDIRVNFRMVKNEAQKAFGNEDIFIEKYLVEPKHIEVQVLGDQYGNIVHLFGARLLFAAALPEGDRIRARVERRAGRPRPAVCGRGQNCDVCRLRLGGHD